MDAVFKPVSLSFRLRLSFTLHRSRLTLKPGRIKIAFKRGGERIQNDTVSLVVA